MIRHNDQSCKIIIRRVASTRNLGDFDHLVLKVQLAFHNGCSSHFLGYRIYKCRVLSHFSFISISMICSFIFRESFCHLEKLGWKDYLQKENDVYHQQNVTQ